MKNKFFESYPDAVNYFETSDGYEFFKQDDAKNHARSLKDKAVKEVKNPNLIEVIESTETTDAPVTDAPATDAPLTEAPTTEAPATEVPVTEAPATEAPAPTAKAKSKNTKANPKPRQ